MRKVKPCRCPILHSTTSVPEQPPISVSPPTPPKQAARPSGAWMLSHPAHWIALGGGSGLSPVAPGTAGSLWAWLVFLVLNPWLSSEQWVAVWCLSLGLGWWACTVTARHLGRADPSEVVWDEVLAVWLIWWLWMPANWIEQGIAFALFRYFDAVKPGPVGWADGLFKTRGTTIGWAQGFGIIFDDLVAAFCTLLTLAIGVRLGHWAQWW